MSAENEEVGPGIAPALFLGLLSFLVGAVLGVASMVYQPVTILTKQSDPENLAPGTVYYIRGDHLGRTAWEAKEEAWKTGSVSVLSLSERELNQWSRKRLKPPVDLEKEEAGFFDQYALSVEPVNFRIDGDRIQMATEVRMEGAMPERSFIYQVTGRFEEIADGVRFIPESGTLGSAPLGKVAPFKGILFSMLSKKFLNTEAGEWVPGSLEFLEGAEIANEQITLRRRADG